MSALNKTSTSEELLKLVGTGNADAWTAFDATYREPMLAYTRSRIPAGLRPQAEDIVQNVFVALAHRMSDFKYESSRGRFRDYLARCIRNEIVNHLTAETRNENAKTRWREKLESETQATQPFADSLLAEAVRYVRNSGQIREETWCIYKENVVDGLDAATVAERHKMTANAVYQIKNRISKLIRDEYDRIQQMRPWHE